MMGMERSKKGGLIGICDRGEDIDEVGKVW